MTINWYIKANTSTRNRMTRLKSRPDRNGSVIDFDVFVFVNGVAKYGTVGGRDVDIWNSAVLEP